MFDEMSEDMRDPTRPSADQGPKPVPLDWDASSLAPDVVSADRLARLELGARRRGLRIRVVGASAELRDLLTFMGLADVLGVGSGGSALQPCREPEQREQALDVEEEADS
jgi:hypothetical protein